MPKRYSGRNPFSAIITKYTKKPAAAWIMPIWPYAIEISLSTPIGTYHSVILQPGSKLTKTPRYWTKQSDAAICINLIYSHAWMSLSSFSNQAQLISYDVTNFGFYKLILHGHILNVLAVGNQDFASNLWLVHFSLNLLCLYFIDFQSLQWTAYWKVSNIRYSLRGGFVCKAFLFSLGT